MIQCDCNIDLFQMHERFKFENYFDTFVTHGLLWAILSHNILSSNSPLAAGNILCVGIN